MSFLRGTADTKKAAPLNLTTLTAKQDSAGRPSECSVFVETAPALESSEHFSQAKWDRQIEVCEHLKTQMDDMNRIFPLHIASNSENNVYRMTTPFTKLSSVEDMVGVLRENELTMRANVTRPREAGPVHTCMEISVEQLEHLMSQSPDENGLKTLNVRAGIDEKAEVEDSSNGNLFLTIVESTQGPHAFAHLEYEIMDKHDAKLHAREDSFVF